MKRTVALLVFFTLFPFVFTAPAYASITIPTSTYFYVSGQWRNFGSAYTFDKVEMIDGIWYFDGKTFDEVEQGSSGSYNVQISVSTNYLPVMGAHVIINGENKTTDLFGLTQWTLPYGDYVIWAYYQGKNQSQAVSINQDRTLGFNFTTTPEPPSPQNFTSFLIVAVVLILGFILLSARRRK